MRILADRHHAGLTQSLILLLEKRLGHELFFPKGMKWWEEGYFKIFNHVDTATQYLERELEGVKGITLEDFTTTPFDVVIATIPDHIEPFKRLCGLHPNHPKLVFQIGNAWPVNAFTVSNVMASAIVDKVPSNVNFVSYHQEFDLDIFSRDTEGRFGETNKITSFVNCFNTEPHFQEDWNLFLEVESLMSNWEFKSFGGQCRDGYTSGIQETADKLRESRFIWHTKTGGDGYGHVVFNAAAIARPLIVKKDYYKGKMGEVFMLDGVTCIAIDGLSPEEIKNKIEYYSDPDEYSLMCNNLFAVFLSEVDFAEDADRVQDFLTKLK